MNKKDINTMTPKELRNLADEIERKNLNEKSINENEIIAKYRCKIKPVKEIIKIGDSYSVEVKFSLDEYSEEYPNIEITNITPCKQLLDFYKSIGYSKIDILETINENLWNGTSVTILEKAVNKSKKCIAMIKILNDICKDCNDKNVNLYSVMAGIFK